HCLPAAHRVSQLSTSTMVMVRPVRRSARSAAGIPP
ncbi:uncharacterized protein METZ01_LOCUS103033, partial [marine metagenome]